MPVHFLKAGCTLDSKCLVANTKNFGIYGILGIKSNNTLGPNECGLINIK